MVLGWFFGFGDCEGVWMWFFEIDLIMFFVCVILGLGVF